MSFFNRAHILITGGGGYLGAKLSEKLVDCNATISLLDISFCDISENIIAANSNVKKYCVDITDKDSLNIACQEIKPDYIYHFAASINRARDFELFPTLLSSNVKGTYNLLQALYPINYKGLFFSSTSEVYGAFNPVPFDEKSCPQPVSPYSLTKLMAENLIITFSKIYNKPCTVLRLFNFFGIDMPEQFFLNQLICAIKQDNVFEMTGGKQIRDFCHIDRVTDFIIAISQAEKINGEIYNICSGKGFMLKDIALLIAALYQKTHLLKIGAIPYRNNEVWDMMGSNKKLLKTISDRQSIQNNDFIEDLKNDLT